LNWDLPKILKPGFQTTKFWTFTMEKPTTADLLEKDHILEQLQIHKVELEAQNEELRTAKLEIEKARDQYFNLYNLAPVGFLTFLHDGTIVEINKTATELLQRSQDVLLQKRFQVFLPEESRQIFNDFCGRVRDTNNIVQCEILIKIHQHRLQNFQLNGYRWVEGGEKREKLYVALVDISQKKELELTLMRNAQLESLGLLAGGIAHDFNNILTTIQGAVSLAHLAAPAVHEMEVELDQIEEAVNRAKSLTAQLLTFSKGGRPVKKLTDIMKLVRKSADFALSGSAIKETVNFPPILPPCLVDENQIAQVIINIINNAKEAMNGAGYIDIAVELVSDTSALPISLEAGQYVKITISDHGQGIPDDIESKVFDPYFSTKPTGHGLGLTICHSIVTNHQGYINFQTQYGEGTSFFIYLPASDEVLGDTPPKIQQPKKFESRKILIMDDDETIVRVMGEMLRKMGLVVEVAKSGEEAIKAFQSSLEADHRFDLVLLDLTIPGGMGGKETIRQLREMDPNIYALVASGYSEDPVLSNFAAYGFNGFLAKPYSIHDVTAVLVQFEKYMERTK
jgi:two-component system, cell cycle sensor histidine kinase and response regulator CckA